MSKRELYVYLISPTNSFFGSPQPTEINLMLLQQYVINGKNKFTENDIYKKSESRNFQVRIEWKSELKVMIGESR